MNRPSFDAPLAFDGVLEGVVLLEIDQNLDAMFLGEAFDQAFSVLPNAATQIIRHTDVQCAAWAAG